MRFARQADANKDAGQNRLCQPWFCWHWPENRRRWLKRQKVSPWCVVMPFSLNGTTHIFTKNAQGGTQRVVVKNSADTAQVILIRQHLQDIREQFLKGDFSGPSHIHGQDMPGLAELKNAKAGQITIVYRDIQGGAQLSYQTSDATYVAAL